MKRIGEEALEKAREEFTSAQEKFNSAANSMPGGKAFKTSESMAPITRSHISGWELTGLGALDTLSVHPSQFIGI